MKKLCVLLPIAAVIAVIYLTGCGRNEPPVIESLAPDPASDTLVLAGDTVKIICTATDPDEDTINYSWQALDGGSLLDPKDSSVVILVTPQKSGDYRIACTVWDDDTLNKVFDTQTIHVQNYFPMAVDNKWIYRGIWGLGDTVTLEATVLSREERAKDTIIWHLKRLFEAKSGTLPLDTFSYYTVVGDTIFFHDAPIYINALDYLAFIMPLWLNKTWDADDSIGIGSVEEKKDFGTDAGNFYDCMRVELRNLANGKQSRTLWVAPDVGIIKQTVAYPGFGAIEFSLIDYELK